MYIKYWELLTIAWVIVAWVIITWVIVTWAIIACVIVARDLSDAISFTILFICLQYPHAHSFHFLSTTFFSPLFFHY